MRSRILALSRVTVHLAIGLTALTALGCANSGSSDDFTSAMKNADYRDSLAHSGKIHLVNGVYREAIDSNVTSELFVHLGQTAVGDLLGDGSMDGAAILITDPGGASTYYQLVAVLNKNGNPVHTASILLGDRIKVRSLTIHDTGIEVQMLTQGPDDPMTNPTYLVTQVYRLEGTGLTRLK